MVVVVVVLLLVWAPAGIYQLKVGQWASLRVPILGRGATPGKGKKKPSKPLTKAGSLGAFGAGLARSGL